MKSYGNLNICTCGKEITYIKTRKPNGRMGVMILHADETIPSDATIPNVSDEYKNWLREQLHSEIVKTEPIAKIPIAKLSKPLIQKESHHITVEAPKKITSSNHQEVGQFSIVSKLLTSRHNTIDDAMDNFLHIVPDADFSFWNENQTSTWLDIYTSHEDKTIIGQIFDGGN